MSIVWNYFTKSKNEARCKKCPKIYKRGNSSTTSLLYHLRTEHNMTIQCNEAATPETNTSGSPLTKYFKPDSKTFSLDEIICRSVAEDGMSVKSFKKSKIMLSYLKSKGFNMPASDKTVWNSIEKFYEIKKKELVSQIELIIKNNGRFSITVDEWTDISQTKYINVTLRNFNENSKSFVVYNLGLEEMKKKCSAANIQNSVKNKLEEFCINLENHIVGSTHDGAAVMRKYGADIPVESQLCMNHAIHLAIIDTLYAKKTNEVEYECEESEGGSEFDDEDVDESDFIEIDTELELKVELSGIINRVRKCCKIFNKSNEKQQKLQSYVILQEKKEIRLIHDVKHRWSSLSKMIENFLRIYKCVNHALLDFNLPGFTENEIRILKNVNDTLRPLDVAIKELSKDTATIIQFEGVMHFLINNLEKANNPLSKDLIEHIKSRLNDRRVKVLNSLILYLKSGTFPTSSNCFKYSSKAETKDYASKLFRRLFSDGEKEVELNTSDEMLVDENLRSYENNLVAELNQSIKKVQNIKNTKKDFYNLLDDFMYLEKIKKRSEKLEMLFNALLSISPTSTISERVFSKSGFIKSKEKNRLKAKHLNCILFLKDYFRRSV